MSDYVRNYISNCQRCIQFRQAPQIAKLQPIDATYPLQVVHMDFLQIGSKKERNTSVLIVTENFTRYAQAYVTHDQTAATVVKVFIDKFITHYGFSLIRANALRGNCSKPSVVRRGLEK